MVRDDGAERWSRGGHTREEDRASLEARRAHKRRQDQQRRNRIRANGPVESFTVTEIGQRDGWLCGICQDTAHPVDPGRKRPHPLSPSIDHIRPVAGGGTHTRDNVRITHWFCNLKKNTYSDELPEYAKATLARRLYGTPIPEALIRARQAHHRDRRERMLADPDLDPRRRELLERMQVAFGRRSRLKEN
ncbi:MAG: putative phage protein [Sphaerisporangium sp.]|jgi:hypothetical protein|nr:putative phage protein [Sphaerisporangium sp.]